MLKEEQNFSFSQTNNNLSVSSMYSQYFVSPKYICTQTQKRNAENPVFMRIFSVFLSTQTQS